MALDAARDRAGGYKVDVGRVERGGRVGLGIVFAAGG